MLRAKRIRCGWPALVASAIIAAPFGGFAMRAQGIAGQRPSSAPPATALGVNAPVTATVRGSEPSRYSVTLPADRWVQIAIEQVDARPRVTVAGPDGAALLTSQGGSRQHDTRTVSFITPADGAYRIDVAGDRTDAGQGHCTLTIAAPREPSADQRTLEQARVLLAQSGDLEHAGTYDAALEPAQRALALRERVLGPDHALVADALHAIAIVYDNKAKYAEAEPVNLRALAIREKAFGPVHPDVAASLYNLAWIYQTRGDYAKSEQTYRRVLAIQEVAIGPDSRETTSTLNDLAILYHAIGDYAKAVEIDERVVSIREHAFGPDDAGVAKSLGNLGLDYYRKGDFQAAEAALLRSLEIYEKAVGPDHPDNGSPLNNLALVYAALGDYASAEPLHLRTLAIYEKALGPDHPTVAIELNNIAWLYQRERRYDEAKPLYLRALAIRERAFGPEHSEVGEALNNLASLYMVNGTPAEQIEPLLQRSQSILERSLGADNVKVSSPMMNLATMALRRRDYAAAERQAERALAIRENALGPDHPLTAELVRTAARIYRAAGDRARAVAYWTKYSDIVERNLQRNLPIGSERQKRSYVGLFAEDVDHVMSLQADAPADDRATDLALTLVLRSKGRALDAMTDTVSALRAHANAADEPLLAAVGSARAQLAAETLEAPGAKPQAYRERLAKFSAAVDAAERAISARSAEYRAQAAPVDLPAVRAAIPSGAALVEFVQYRPTAPDGDAAAARYAGFVVFSDRPAVRVDIGDAASVDALIDRWRRALRDPRSVDARTIARELDERVMRPLRDRIGAARRLLVSADGLLNLVPFAALVDENGAYLVERYAITYLTSGRDLLRLQVPRPARSDAVVVADPLYGEPALVAGRRDRRTDRIDYSQMFFGPLPGVASEVRALRTLLPSATFLTKESATKSALMAVKGPRILHIATHGFFLDDDSPDRQAPAVSTLREDDTRLGKVVAHVDNPLLRSGLALAGANRGGERAGSGVLTALEAADLDLWGTRLVVLSACDTGVGEVRTGDGVYGLRRALVLSGAESQLMSLWPVSDRGTRDVIVGYYRALLSGDGRGDALRAAQLQMLRANGRVHPYYWAGFILSGQWGPLGPDR